MKRSWTPLPVAVLVTVSLLAWWCGRGVESAFRPLAPRGAAGEAVAPEAPGGARLAGPASRGAGARLVPAPDPEGHGPEPLFPQAPALAGMGVRGFVEGYTKDLDCVPIAGALVTGYWALDDLGGALGEARTDERGGFALSPGGLSQLLPGELAEAEVQLQVQANGWPLYLEDLGLSTHAGGRWEAPITLDDGPCLSLRVLDPAGAPVPNVDVRLGYVSSGEDDWDWETSDAAGYVLFGLPAEGAQDLYLYARLPQVGYGSASWEVPPADPVELILQPRGTIAGRVVDTEGRGVAGIEVFALGTEQDEDGEEDWSTVCSGPRGEFALVDLGPGDFSIQVTGLTAWPEIPVGTTGLELVIELPALDVRVVGPGGAPVRGVQLEVFPVRSEGQGGVLPLREGRLVASEGLGAGIFGVVFPEPGPYSVLARQPEANIWASSLVQAGSQRELTLVLRPDRPQAEVDLQVVDEAGQPLKRKPLVEWLEPGSGARLSIGEVGLQQLAAGPWTLRVSDKDQRHVPSVLSLELQAGELRPLRVVCPRGAKVELFVEGPTEAQQGMQVYLWPEGAARGEACALLELSGCGAMSATHARTARRYRLIGAHPVGTYRLQLDAGGGLRSDRRVDLLPGDQVLRMSAPEGLR